MREFKVLWLAIQVAEDKNWRILHVMKFYVTRRGHQWMYYGPFQIIVPGLTKDWFKPSTWSWPPRRYKPTD